MTMVIVWWSKRGIIHYNFLNPGETVTAARYCEEIDEIDQKLSHLYPALFSGSGPILLRGNPRPHVSQITVQKLIGSRYEILPHPIYSPDLSSIDSHLFKQLDNFLREGILKNQAEVGKAFEVFTNLRPREFYTSRIEKLASCWWRCIGWNGSHLD